MNGEFVRQGFAPFAGLTLAAGYLLWIRPRLSVRVAWAVTLMVAAAGLVAVARGSGQTWLLPIVALLAGHAVLDRQGRDRGAPVSRPLAPAAQSLEPPVPTNPGGVPSRLGRYDVEGELGRGAMGTVWLGRDRANGEAVALKTIAWSRIHDEGDRAEARQRFLREVETARRLRHPDIVALVEGGEVQGLAYFAMALMPGHDLRRHASPGNLLPVPTLLRILARVADALAHAHGQGVVHRDIKPANVIVDPASGRVAVTDFGIARIAGGEHTRTGVALGTPAYMAPEQLAGGPVDERTDLYALGVTLFQLLTGRLPHEADSMGELMRQIAQQPAPDLRGLRPELPESLAVLVAGLLDKAPARRPADGRQVAAALRDIADRLPGDPAP